MEKDEVLKIVVKHLAPCFNGNMQINQKAVEGIWNDCKMQPACVAAMKKVVEWFNKKNLGLKSTKYQERYIGAVCNLLTLLAMNDIENLVQNWVLSDME